MYCFHELHLCNLILQCFFVHYFSQKCLLMIDWNIVCLLILLCISLMIVTEKQVCTLLLFLFFVFSSFLSCIFIFTFSTFLKIDSSFTSFSCRIFIIVYINFFRSIVFPLVFPQLLFFGYFHHYSVSKKNLEVGWNYVSYSLNVYQTFL